MAAYLGLHWASGCRPDGACQQDSRAHGLAGKWKHAAWTDDTIQHTVAGAAHKILRRNTSRLDDGGGSLRRNGE